MKREKSLRIAITVLSVALAACVCALVCVLVGGAGRPATDTAASPGNGISPALDEHGYVPASQTPRLFQDAPASPEKIRLREQGKETALPFAVGNLLPGDTAEKVFVVTVADKSAQALSFSAILTSGSVPGDKLTLTVKAGNTVLYNGKFATVADRAYSVSAPCDVTYTVTVALDKSAGNEYAGLSLGMSFVWSYSYEEYDPVTVTYTDGVLGAAFQSQTTVTKAGEATPAFVGTPTREGYVFAGWYPEVQPTVTQNVTYTAEWAAEVVFLADGKETRVTVAEGSPAEKPPVPEKAGCGFAGWYLDEDFTQKFDFSAPVTAGVTLHARFFRFGDVDGNGRITAADADLIGLYVMEVESDNIHNIMAGRVTAAGGAVTANDADAIVRYVMEAIDGFSVETAAAGREYDLEHGLLLPPR